MKRIILLLLIIVALNACSSEEATSENTTSKDNAEVPEEAVSTSAEYIVKSRSVMLVTFYTGGPQQVGRMFIELTAGDQVRFTGRTVTFPTGLDGYEFEVTSMTFRDPEESYISTPVIGDICYLSMEEIRNNLELADAGS